MLRNFSGLQECWKTDKILSDMSLLKVLSLKVTEVLHDFILCFGLLLMILKMLLVNLGLKILMYG